MTNRTILRSVRTPFLSMLIGVFGAGFVSVPGQGQSAVPENSKVETVATLPSSGPTENLAQAADGSIYITGLDDKVLYKVTNGRVETLATFPNHAAILGVAAGNNELVLTVFTKPYRRTTPPPDGLPGRPDFSDVGPEVLVLDKTGKVAATVAGQKGQAFNGIAPAGGGIYVIADSGASMLWRFNSAKKQLEPWVRDVPGANGIKVLNGWVYVTTRNGMQKVQIESNGRPGPLTVFAKDIRGDDFAIAKDGTIYIPGTMGLVKVTAKGEAITLLDNTPGGAAAIVSNDGRWIYWATRGGNKPQRLVRVAIE